MGRLPFSSLGIIEPTSSGANDRLPPFAEVRPRVLDGGSGPKPDIVLVAIMMALTQTDTDLVATPVDAALKWNPIAAAEAVLNGVRVLRKVRAC